VSGPAEASSHEFWRDDQFRPGGWDQRSYVLVGRNVEARVQESGWSSDLLEVVLG